MRTETLWSASAGARGCGQRGAALVVTLIFLTMMTIVGVTALRTTRIDQDIATNFQETNRALQTAETGIVDSLADINWIADVATAHTGSGTTGMGYFNYSRQFMDFFPLGRRKSQVFSAVHFQRAQFTVESDAEVKTGESADAIATATVNEGMYLVVPKI